MNIQEAIKTGRPIRRKYWVTKEFRDFHELTLDELDILADDWEVEPKKIETEVVLEDIYGDKIRIIASNERWYLQVLDRKDIDFSFGEEDVDKLLTFLYNNTKIGKSRVIPF